MKKEGKDLVCLNKNQQYVAMVAPSFIAEFDYPDIILYLKKAGFDKIVELTFGAKLVNREYHRILKKSGSKLIISTVCPGIVDYITQEYPQYKKNLIKVVSPMIAMARICRKFYPKHKIVFISPCNFKKREAEASKDVDYVIDYQSLRALFKKLNININKKVKIRPDQQIHFNKFYNDYTKIYPLTGGLTRTAHLRGIVGANDTEILDGVCKLKEFLKNPDKKIKFIDANFCVGGCVGGPCLSNELSLGEKEKKVTEYMKKAKYEKIPVSHLGLLEKAKNIKLKLKI